MPADRVTADRVPADRVTAPAGAGRWPALAAVLGALGAWSIVVPYLGPRLGFELAVAGRVEVVDHVVPGLAIGAGGALALSLLRGGRSGSVPSLALACAIALAGLWITATHVPLLADAGRGLVPWGTAWFHAAPGALILALALALVLHEARAPQPP